MQKIIQEPVFTSRSVQFQEPPRSSGFLLNGLLLLVSVPAAVITFAILVAMVPVRILGTWFK